MCFMSSRHSSSVLERAGKASASLPAVALSRYCHCSVQCLPNAWKQISAQMLGYRHVTRCLETASRQIYYQMPGGKCATRCVETNMPPDAWRLIDLVMKQAQVGDN